MAMNSITEKQDRNLSTALKRKNSNTETGEVNEDKITGIAELQRYCQLHKLEFPCYKIIETTDFCNNKMFTVCCTLKDLIETATGKNKKQAKHKAAYYLLERLKYRAINGCKDLMNENSDDSLEEGEIDDREEGEIRDDSNDIKEENQDDSDDNIPGNDNKRKRYKIKKVYLEGNVKNNNINLVNNIQNKSQVQLLAEFCFEQKLPPPKYEISEHVGLRAPIFTCQCSVLQLVMRTSGKRKKDVKEKSSKMLLDKMKRHSEILKSSDDNDKKIIKYELEDGEIPDEKSNVNRKDNGKNTQTNVRKKIKTENNENSNPNSSVLPETGMSELYNFCAKSQLPPPVYTMLDKKDVTPSKKIFTFQCSVLKFSKISHGLNKKQAKHRAARLVLENLRNWNKGDIKENESDLEEGEIDEKDEAIKQEYIKRKLESNFVTREEKNMHLLESITERHNVIKTSKPYTESKTLSILHKLDDLHIMNQPSLLLNQICKEMDVTYNFIDFKSPVNSVTGLFLNSVPPWSTIGDGNTKEEAQLTAIRKMLTFLKHMSQ